MAETTHGTGGLTFDKSKRSWPNELNIVLALIIIIVIFELIGQLAPYMRGQSFLFDTRDRFDSIFNEARLKIIMRDKRCNATTANPRTGTRDVQVPAILQQHLGHMDFGVYAQVTKGGTVRQGDEARLI